MYPRSRAGNAEVPNLVVTCSGFNLSGGPARILIGRDVLAVVFDSASNELEILKSRASKDEDSRACLYPFAPNNQMKHETQTLWALATVFQL